MRFNDAKVIKAMIDSGLTNDELAMKANVTRSAVYKSMNNAFLTETEGTRISRALGCTVFDLLQ